MEKLIEKLEGELRDVAEGKSLAPLRDVCFLRTVISALQWTSVGYYSALRLAGMKFGKRVGEGSGKTEFSLVLEEIKRIITALRGGKVEFKVLPESGGAELKIYDSPFMADVPNVLQNLCFFEEGFIEGYIDGVIAKNGPLAVASTGLSVSKTSVEEKRCVGLGDDYCGFLIKF
jgi:predicted hydrocarbon binding protein